MQERRDTGAHLFSMPGDELTMAECSRLAGYEAGDGRIQQDAVGLQVAISWHTTFDQSAILSYDMHGAPHMAG